MSHVRFSFPTLPFISNLIIAGRLIDQNKDENIGRTMGVLSPLSHRPMHPQHSPPPFYLSSPNLSTPRRKARDQMKTSSLPMISESLSVSDFVLIEDRKEEEERRKKYEEMSEESKKEMEAVIAEYSRSVEEIMERYRI
jgi:hypothetical protein